MAHTSDLVLASELCDVAEDVRSAAAGLMPDNPGRCRAAGERYHRAAELLLRYAERLAERGRTLAPPRPRRPRRVKSRNDERQAAASLESRYRNHHR